MTETGVEIERIRRKYGKRLLILGHHYQRPEVLGHADAIGDSLELARRAAGEKEAEKVAFCGVHFMAESADILTTAHQTVYMPEPAAGCPMAGMADEQDARLAWETLRTWSDEDWLPIVYINSTAAIKALCGMWGGSTCTSSNAAKVFNWALGQGKRILFLPDEHLGANTARDLRIPDDEVAVYDPGLPGGGLPGSVVPCKKIVVWKGYCHVHTAFTVEQVRAVRQRWPGALIIVHPETPKEVVELADAHGSTSRIIKYVESAPAGSTIFVGTEANLVERLARQHAGRVTVKVLTHSICPNMYMTSEESLLRLLSGWPASNEIHVSPSPAGYAREALGRMLSI